MSRFGSFFQNGNPDTGDNSHRSLILATLLPKRTGGPLAEGQTLAFCERCANFS